jgi:hypothetical protein
MSGSAVPGTAFSGSRTELMGTAEGSIDTVPGHSIRTGSGNHREPTPPNRFPGLPPLRGEPGPRGPGEVAL